MKIIFVLGAASVALVAGCSSDSGVKASGTAPGSASSSAALSAVSSSAPTSAVSSTAAAAVKLATGADLVARFQSAGLPVTGVVVFTAATDPNHLLGRPNGYVAKRSWVDSRIHRADAVDTDRGSMDLGGSVESYTKEADATARVAYIRQILKAAPAFGNEYDYVVGRNVLRISGILTPAQAGKYQSAITG